MPLPMAYPKDYLFKDHISKKKESPVKRPRSREGTPVPDEYPPVQDSYPTCECGERAKEGITMKGPNKGRPYWACNENKCRYFEWADLSEEEREREREKKRARMEKKPPRNFFEDADRSREVALTLLAEKIANKQESDEVAREKIVKQLEGIRESLSSISKSVERLSKYVSHSHVVDSIGEVDLK